MSWITAFMESLWHVTLDAAPWLLLGLIVAGLIKAFLPANLLSRWLGGRGTRPIIWSAILGTPLPLCSCSVVPAAVTLRRGGASRGATASFLVATPENGADSIALTYALLGPFMTVLRPVAAILSAVTTGLLTLWFAPEAQNMGRPPTTSAQPKPAPCCDSGSSCCDDETPANDAGSATFSARCRAGLTYAAGDLLRDIALWLAIGLVLAALINTLVPPGELATWGSGIGAMVLLMLIGVPMYICATASTPVAASMLIAGVSPGAVLVFLLAGPATNIGTLGIIRRELGTRATVAYLIGIAVTSIALGLATDAVVSAWSINVAAQAGGEHHVVPYWLAVTSVVLLGLLVVRIYTTKWWTFSRDREDGAAKTGALRATR
jgi:uncharacterized membrane protein YraQ (UPF0718 family)